MSATNGMVMPTSIGGCIGSILSTAFKLGAFVRGITNAPTHIQRICAKAESCRAMVLSLRILLAQMGREGGSDQAGLELIYVSNLANTLLGCQETLGLIEKELEGLMKENMKIGKDERARWVWRELEIKELLSQLDEHKMELILNLNILNCHQGQELRKQNAEILNRMYSNQRPASIKSATSIRSLRRVLSTPNKKKQPSLSLNIIPEYGDLETVGELRNNPEHETDSSSTSILSTETNTPSVSPIFVGSDYTSRNSTYSITVAGFSFQEILLASKVYQRRSLKRKTHVLQSNITLSELHHSNASILSYSLRRSFSPSASLAILTTGAPHLILSHNRSRKELDAAFAEAVKKQNLKTIATLLEYGADINVNQEFKFLHKMEKGNLLHIACSRRLQNLAPNSLVVKFLVDHGADLNALTGYTRITPFYIAILEGNIELAQLLLSYGADVNIQNKEGNTIFHMAGTGEVEIGCEVLQLFLENGGAIDIINHTGETALFIAVQYGRLAVAKFLVEAGANVNIQDKKGRTPLHTAYQSADSTYILLQHGANIHTQDGNHDTALSYAISHGVITPEVLKLLLDFGADASKKNKQGMAALHLACKMHNGSQIVKMLLEHNADRDVDAVDGNGETPLMKAISIGALESVKLLLKAGADSTKTNIHGKTPLHFATLLVLWQYRQLKNEFVEITQLLLEHGADVNAEDENGDTPLLNTMRGRGDKLAEVLVKAGAKTNKQGMTPLHLAWLHHHVGRNAKSHSSSGDVPG